MKITFELLSHEMYTFTTTSSGKGRDKVVTPHSGIKCKLGDLPLDEWIEKMNALIDESGEQELQHDLQEYVSSLPWQHMYSKNKIILEALVLHSTRIFDNELWADYIPFNQKYRPEILDTAKMEQVVYSCCEKPCFVMRTRIENAVYNLDHQKINLCPICGQWSAFREISPTERIQFNGKKE